MTIASKHRKIVGSVLRERREQIGLSQEKVGFKARLHPTYVSSAERGHRNISIEALRRWCAAIDMTWESFGRAVDRHQRA